jgi:hypothetical protein
MATGRLIELALRPRDPAGLIYADVLAPPSNSTWCGDGL